MTKPNIVLYRVSDTQVAVGYTSTLGTLTLADETGKDILFDAKDYRSPSSYQHTIEQTAKKMLLSVSGDFPPPERF